MKEPWHCSSHFKALGQMGKVAASHVDVAKYSRLDGTCIESMLAALSMYPHIVLVIVLMNSH